MFRWLEAVPPEAFAPTKSLADVVASVRPEFEALISQAQAWGMQPKIRSAGRTCAQQNEQLKAGYSQAGLCRSMHVLGHAIDLDLMPNTCATYTKLGQWWEARGGVWGGRWTQFGACGDAGHYHMGFNKAQAVPTSVCPGDLSLAECEKLRHDYLSKNLSGGEVTSKMGLTAGLLMIVAGGAFVWGVMRVKPGLKLNPELWQRPVLALEPPPKSRKLYWQGYRRGYTDAANGQTWTEEEQAKKPHQYVVGYWMGFRQEWGEPL